MASTETRSMTYVYGRVVSTTRLNDDYASFSRSLPESVALRSAAPPTGISPAHRRQQALGKTSTSEKKEEMTHGNKSRFEKLHL